LGEILEITRPPVKRLIGFSENIQTLPNGTSRAFLLFEMFGFTWKISIYISKLKN
jgi:hypothetical protein